MIKKRLLSGIQPSGDIHLGNYLGAIQNWVKLLPEYDAFFCIVDYHAITIKYDTTLMQKRIFDAAVINIASGLDIENCTLFVQSDVPEHTELAWILNSVTPLGDLSRMTQFKEKKHQHQSNINAGLFTYPVLQAADILLYHASVVPVGDDQKQHIELTRDIARNFNNRYSDILTLPNPIIPKEGARIKGLDGKAKMSKSMNNYIALTDTEDDIWAKLKTAFTDENRQRLKDPGNPDNCNIYSLHNFFTDKETTNDINTKCRNAEIGCFDCKKILCKNLVRTLTPIQEKAATLRSRPDDINDMLVTHGKRARAVARETLDNVRESMGLQR